MSTIKGLTLGALFLLSLSMSGQAIAQEPVCSVDLAPSAQLNECNTYSEFLVNWTCVYQYLEQLIENSEPLPYSENEAIERFLGDTCDLI